MGKFNWQDVKTAFVEIAKVISVLVIQCVKVVGYVITAFVVFSIVGYLVFNWFLLMLTLFGIAAFCFWFYVEMQSAKSIREYEELQEAWFAEKRKPAHPEYKEQQ